MDGNETKDTLTYIELFCSKNSSKPFIFGMFTYAGSKTSYSAKTIEMIIHNIKIHNIKNKNTIAYE